MMGLLLPLAILALVGHAALWIGLVNRVHSTASPRWLVKSISLLGYFLLVFIPLAAAGTWLYSGQMLDAWRTSATSNPAVWIYLLPCCALGLIAIGLWIQRRWLSQTPDAIRDNHTRLVDVGSLLGYKPLFGVHARLLSFFPGNQVLQLAVQEKICVLEKVPPALDGLSIAHLSDLHITGRIGIDFFHEVVNQTILLRPELIAVTGDIIDEIELLDWIPKIFSRLSAPLGIYFVLGNHDLFTRDPERVRQSLVSVGSVDLGRRRHRLDASGSSILLAGNELPWFKPAAETQEIPPRSPDQTELRVLLSHSPDQFAWARRRDFDLMLAGHTHGGQISPPFIGPILAPSWHGVKYASGTFYKRPTLMHVSRGVSAELPIRLNCRPELTKIVLRSSG